MCRPGGRPRRSGRRPGRRARSRRAARGRRRGGHRARPAGRPPPARSARARLRPGADPGPRDATGRATAGPRPCRCRAAGGRGGPRLLGRPRHRSPRLRADLDFRRGRYPRCAPRSPLVRTASTASRQGLTAASHRFAPGRAAGRAWAARAIPGRRHKLDGWRSTSTCTPRTRSRAASARSPTPCGRTHSSHTRPTPVTHWAAGWAAGTASSGSARSAIWTTGTTSH